MIAEMLPVHAGRDWPAHLPPVSHCGRRAPIYFLLRERDRLYVHSRALYPFRKDPCCVPLRVTRGGARDPRNLRRGRLSRGAPTQTSREGRQESGSPCHNGRHVVNIEINIAGRLTIHSRSSLHRTIQSDGSHRARVEEN